MLERIRQATVAMSRYYLVKHTKKQKITVSSMKAKNLSFLAGTDRTSCRDTAGGVPLQTFGRSW